MPAKSYAVPAAAVRPDPAIVVGALALPPAALAGGVVWLCITTPEPRQAIAWASLCGAAVFAAIFARLRERSIVRALSFRVVVDDETISSVRPPHARVTIGRAELGPVREVEGRGLLVWSSDERRAIFVPASVTDYDDLRARIAAWRPIELVRPAPTWALVPPLASAATIAALCVTLLAQRPAMVLAAGGAVVLAVGAALIVIALDPRGSAARSARALWRLLPAAIAVAKMWLVLRASPT